VLLFFDDILIYNKSSEEHVQHVYRVLQLFEVQQIYVNTSKCSFGVQEVEYLGHIVSHQGVKVDRKNIDMREFPILKILKKNRGFLGFTCYYCKFVKRCGQIAEPITKLLKKESF
jgi:hypothetical protein